MIEIPFGDVLACFVTDEAILLAFPDQCILANQNFNEIKRLPIKYLLSDVVAGHIQEEPTLLFSHIIP